MENINKDTISAADGFETIKELSTQQKLVSADALEILILEGSVPEKLLNDKLMSVTTRSQKLRPYDHIQLKDPNLLS